MAVVQIVLEDPSGSRQICSGEVFTSSWVSTPLKKASIAGVFFNDIGVNYNGVHEIYATRQFDHVRMGFESYDPPVTRLFARRWNTQQYQDCGPCQMTVDMHATDSACLLTAKYLGEKRFGR